MTEANAMRRALELANRGWGRVHPNPMVGAVVLAGDSIVGEGHHAEFGGPHAETIALAAAGDRARGGTLVVTLEPCAHLGKQPACIDGIVQRGIRRVVAATADPNPVAAGGAVELRSRGVEVDIGLLRDLAERQNAAYHHAVSGARRPFTVVKLSTSLDHKIADPAGHSRWISGEEARDFVHWTRAGFDAIGVGGRTASVDNPALTVRGPVEARVPPRRVVFLGGRRLAPDSTLMRTAKEIPTIAVVDGLFQSEGELLVEHGVDVLPAAGLDDAMEGLWSRGIRSLLIEGGGRLTGSLLARKLVDRFIWIVSPLWLGDGAVPAVRGLGVAPLIQAERWTLVDRRGLGQDTALIYDQR